MIITSASNNDLINNNWLLFLLESISIKRSFWNYIVWLLYAGCCSSSFTLLTKKINELVGLSPSFDWYSPVVVHHACLGSSLSKHPNNNQPLGVENIMVYRCFRGGWSTRRLQTTTWINNWLLFLLESISIKTSFPLRGTSIRYEITSFDCCSSRLLRFMLKESHEQQSALWGRGHHRWMMFSRWMIITSRCTSKWINNFVEYL